jgi:CheY-like chemotaxis protein
MLTVLAIIAMTADVLQDCREQCTAAGMDDYVAKPVSVDDMVEAVKKWLPRVIPEVNSSEAVQSVDQPLLSPD